MSSIYFPKIHFPQKNPLFNFFHHKIINEQYGRSEVLKSYRVHITKGLIISVALHLFVLASYFIINELKNYGSDEKIIKVRILKYSDLGPPPSLTQTSVAPSLQVSSSVKPSVGIPIPVPDAEVNPENTIATQTELSAVRNETDLSNSGESGGGILIEDDLNVDEPGMNDFVAVENPPQIISAQQPDYPEIARRAGLEGSVWVKILVGKDGKPIRAVSLNGASNELFEEEAIKAAMKYKFTPATMSMGPVKVWVSIKFKFQLKSTEKK